MYVDACMLYLCVYVCAYVYVYVYVRTTHTTIIHFTITSRQIDLLQCGHRGPTVFAVRVETPVWRRSVREYTFSPARLETFSSVGWFLLVTMHLTLCTVM